MKLAVVIACLSVAVAVVMIFQTLRQELHLHQLKISMVVNAEEVKRKESAIIEIKNKVSELKTSLASIDTKMTELKMKKEELETSMPDLEKTLQTCTTEKESIMMKKDLTAENINKLSAEHEAVESKAEEEIQSLKQQLLDRDQAICAFADTTKEEVGKLCGIAEAPK